MWYERRNGREKKHHTGVVEVIHSRRVFTRILSRKWGGWMNSDGQQGTNVNRINRANLKGRPLQRRVRTEQMERITEAVAWIGRKQSSSFLNSGINSAGNSWCAGPVSSAIWGFKRPLHTLKATHPVPPARMCHLSRRCILQSFQNSATHASAPPSAAIIFKFGQVTGAVDSHVYCEAKQVIVSRYFPVVYFVHFQNTLIEDRCSE